MKKRILAAALWFYALWCIGAALQMAVGLPEVLGPLAGFVAACILLAPAVKARRANVVPVRPAPAVRPTSTVRDSI